MAGLLLAPDQACTRGSTRNVRHMILDSCIKTRGNERSWKTPEIFIGRDQEALLILFDCIDRSVTCWLRSLRDMPQDAKDAGITSHGPGSYAEW